MAHRGRKPVDVELLRIHATQWACLLYGVRDGYPGQLQRVEWGPIEIAHIREREVPTRRSKATAATTIVYPGSKQQAGIEKMLEKISGALQREGYVYFRPVAPKPEIWQQLKQAKQRGQTEDVFRKMRSWAIGLRSSSRRISIRNTRAMYL